MSIPDMPPVPSRAEPPAPKRSRWRRVLAWMALTLVLLVVLAVLGLLAALRTEPGARQVWQLATRLSAGTLSGEFESGTLANGLRLRDVVLAQGETRIAVDHLDGNWAVTWGLGSAPPRLQVNWLRIGTLDVRLPAGKTEGEPATMPKSLELPLAVDVDTVTVDHFSLLRGPAVTATPLVLSELAAAVHSDGVSHRINIDKLVTPYGTLAANAQIGGKAPFPLTGEALLTGRWQQENFNINARMDGSLQALRLNVDASGDRLRGRAEGEATPFGPVPFTRLLVTADQINPKLFDPAAPQASLSVRAELRPVGGAPRPDGQANALTVAGDIIIRNADPGALDADRLPLRSAQAHVTLGEARQTVDDLRILLTGNAEIRGKGELADSRGGFDLDVRNLDPHALHKSMQPMRLSGPVIVRLEPGRQGVVLDLAGGEIRLFADAHMDGDAITVTSLRAGLGSGMLTAEGKLGLKDQQAFSATGKLANLDPARLAAVAAGRINATFSATGTLAGEPRVAVEFAVQESEYAGLPMTGAGRVRLAGQRLLPSEASLQMAGNQANLRGSFGAPGDRMRLTVDAPQLERLKFGVAGMLRLDADIAGTMRRPTASATFTAQSLVVGPHRIANASGQVDMPQGIEGPFKVTLAARDYRGPEATLRTVDASLDGTQANHAFSVHTAGQRGRHPVDATVAGQGSWRNGGSGAGGGARGAPVGAGWTGTIRTLEEKGTVHLKLLTPAQLAVSDQRLVLDGARFQLEKSTLAIDSLAFDHGRIRTAGALDGVQVSHLLDLMETFTGTRPPVRSDVVLDGRWRLDFAETASGFAEIKKRSGDVTLDAGRGSTALQLGEAFVRADVVGNRINLRGNVVSSRVGAARLDGSIGLVQVNNLLSVTPASALGGQLALDVPRIKSLEAFVGPQYAFDGKVAAALRLAGTLGKPVITGTVDGEGIGITLFDEGLRLTDGTIHLVLNESEIVLRQVEFHGGDGKITATGSIKLDSANPDLTARIVADRLQLFASPERTLILSGTADIGNENKQLMIRGKFRVDRGLFDLPRAGAPVLGDDVVVVRRKDEREVKTAATQTAEDTPASRFSPRIELTLDLGDNFRFRGSGADLRLGGQMNIVSAPLQPLRATGTVRVTDGTYEAFGRRLQIQRGIINFNGPLNNPNINIRAMRVNQEVEAGVEVTGTVRLPRVRLVSEPNVPDEDKLSWLMFGYGAEGTSGSQQRALSGGALGGAALGMLGSRAGKGVVSHFGIDEFSIGPSSAGLNEQQVVSIGKSVSERLSVGYEQSLTSASNVVKLTLALSRRWSLIAKAGSINGMSVLFNRRFDTWEALFTGASNSSIATRRGQRNASQPDGDEPAGRNAAPPPEAEPEPASAPAAN